MLPNRWLAETPRFECRGKSAHRRPIFFATKAIFLLGIVGAGSVS
jgi:hypothetical protein